MKKFSILLIVIAFILGYILSAIFSGDSNSKLIYGDTGLPKNCRAIIKANYEGAFLDKITPENALDSINRNCGEFGLSWGLK